MSYILVVEDDKAIYETITLYFDLIDKRSFVVSNYKDTLKCLLKNGPPSIILLDYILHGQGAEEIIIALKYMCPNSKMFLMTAKLGLEEIVKQFSMQGLLNKPFSLEELDATIT